MSYVGIDWGYSARTFAGSIAINEGLAGVGMAPRPAYENGRLYFVSANYGTWASQFAANLRAERLRRWGYRHTRQALALLTSRGR